MDITPDQDRRMYVSVLNPNSFNSIDFNAEADLVYEQYSVRSPPNGVFEEPLDLEDINGGRNVDPVRHHPYPDPFEHQKYHSERERLKSFEGHWKPEYHVSKEDLAKDGFVYKGPGDTVLCVFCLKTIRKWEAGDNVPSEHKRIYPRCPWVNGRVNHINKPMSEADHMKQEMRLQRKGIAQITDMQQTSQRAKSFDGWIGKKNVDVNDLVKAGFFYDDIKGCITCFQCGFCIPESEINPNFIQLHAESSYQCPKVVESKNRLNAEQVQHNLDGSRVEVNEASNVDKDAYMQSPAVQAIFDSFGSDYSVESIRKAVEAIRLEQGSGEITSEDILKKMDPDLNN